MEDGSSFCRGFRNFILLSLGKKPLDLQTSPDTESIALNQNVSELEDLGGDGGCYATGRNRPPQGRKGKNFVNCSYPDTLLTPKH